MYYLVILLICGKTRSSVVCKSMIPLQSVAVSDGRLSCRPGSMVMENSDSSGMEALDAGSGCLRPPSIDSSGTNSCRAGPDAQSADHFLRLAKQEGAGMWSSKDAGSVEPTAGGGAQNSGDTGKPAGTGGWGTSTEPPFDTGGSTGSQPPRCPGLAGALK